MQDETTSLLGEEGGSQSKPGLGNGLTIQTGKSAVSSINKELADSPATSPRPTYAST
jgi:hypothetical protein